MFLLLNEVTKRLISNSLDAMNFAVLHTGLHHSLHFKRQATLCYQSARVLRKELLYSAEMHPANPVEINYKISFLISVFRMDVHQIPIMLFLSRCEFNLVLAIANPA